jgi:hypothetical protein
MNFLEITRKLLKDKADKHKLTLLQIAIATDLSYSWVCKISGGSLTNPSYQKLQSLHDYLSKLK